jgi:hypothetical protein
MASPSGIRAGRAFVELFGDDSKLVRVLNRAEARVKAFGAGLMTFGAKLMAGGLALAVPLLGAVRTFASMGDTVAKMSLRTGVSAESLSELGFAAEQSGSDLSSLENGLRRMQRTIEDAGRGLSTSIDALDNLGLKVEDLQNLSPEEQFKLIADRMAGIADPTTRAATAMEIFGRSGTQLLPLMQNGAAGIETLQKQARELGLTISTQDANAAAVLTDTLNILWRSFKQGVFVIGAALAPTIKGFAEKATAVITRVSQWIRNNKELVVTAFRIAAGVVAAGAAIIGLGAIIYGVGMALGVLSSIAAGVGAVITGVVTVLGLVASMLGAILSPLGLVVGGLTALVGYFLYTGQAGDYVGGVLGWLGEMFGYLKDVALRSWNAITAAIASGDIGAAMNVAWTTIKMLWAEGINWLYQKWVGFKGWFLQIWNEAVYGTAMLMTEAWAGLQRTWVTVVSFLKKIWSEFTTWAANTWNTMQQSIGGVFIDALAKVGVLSEQEAKWAKEDMNKSLEDKKRQRSQDSADYLAQIEAEKNKRKNEITADENAALDALTSEMLAKDRARNKGLEKDLAAAKESAAKAKREWEDSLAAAEAAGAMPGTKGPPGKPRPPGEFEGLDIAGKSKAEIASTFNAFALAGLGTGSNYAAETAVNTRETRRLLRQIQTDGIKILATP